MRKLFVLPLLVSLVSCGGGSTAPSAAAIAQIAGVWRVTSRATAITSSECVGQLLNANGGVGTTSIGTARITQSGATANVTITDNSTGGATVYAGTVGASSLGLTYQSCNLCVIRNIQCSPGIFRDITPQADSVTATVSGSSMNGSEATTYNVTVSSSGAGAGLLVVNSTFSATKQ